jgi:lysophospholipase L1-like esterase
LAGARRPPLEGPLVLGPEALGRGGPGAAAPAPQPTMTSPVTGSVFPLTAPTSIKFIWTTVPGAADYLFEFTAPDRSFTNPNAPGPDPVNGFGGAGGAVIVEGTSFRVVLDGDFPPGVYEVRVLARRPDESYLGTASDAITVALGLEHVVPPDTRPALTAPPSGFRVTRGDPTPFTFAWSPVDEVVEYFLEYTGPDLAFTNPGEPGFDPVNGFGGAGGGVVVSGTALAVVLAPSFPVGTYQVRVSALSAAGHLVGAFSEAITVVNGFWLPPDLSVVLTGFGAAYGDSITEGVLGDPGNSLADRPYPEVLTGLLQPAFPGFLVVNRGVGGETTAAGLSRLQGDVGDGVPAVVLLMEGTNDATFRKSPDSIVDNLRAMVRVVKQAGAIPVLGAIVPNFRPFASQAQSIIGDVNARLPEVAAEEGVRFVDTFAAMNNPGLFGADDLHPTQEGYEVLAGAWLPAVTDALHDLLNALDAVGVADAAAAR